MHLASTLELFLYSKGIKLKNNLTFDSNVFMLILSTF